jgi:hypothetical protein
VAIGIIGAFLFTQVKDWIFLPKFIGTDTSQYIHMVYYYMKNPHFIVSAWDHIWFNGVPRIIDTSWIHYTLIAFATRYFDIYQVLKISPVITFFLGAIFVYLFFYEVSRSILVSLALSISFVLGKGYYSPLFENGVVISTMSQMFLPMQLYFLARFIKRGNYKNLILASIVSSIGLGGHVLLMIVFGVFPSLIFLLFSNNKGEHIWNIFSKKALLNAFLFGFITFLVGAVSLWPYLDLLFSGGAAIQWRAGYLVSDPKTLGIMINLNNPGSGLGLVAAVIVAIPFIFYRKKLDKAFGSIFALFIWYTLWMISYTVVGNLFFLVMFPGRIYWIWSLVLGGMTSVLVASMELDAEANGLIKKIGKFTIVNLSKIIVSVVILFATFLPFGENLNSFLSQLNIPKKWETVDIAKQTKQNLDFVLSHIDNNNTNERLWTHVSFINLSWIPVSNVPLSEGYAHFWTRYSRLWEGWFYGTLSASNWESQEIPRDMATQQSLFFIDWYGIKYLSAQKGAGSEWDIADHFYNKSDYVEDIALSSTGQSVITISSDYTSPIVSSVNTPVVGFVGSDDSYMTFVKDIAVLNLNTSYLIPVRLSTSLSGITANKLKYMDALVIYDYKNGLFGGSKWSEIEDFVKKGGKVWIETGGNSILSQSGNLPAIFPISQNKLGPLDENWIVTGEMADRLDFSQMSKLIFKGNTWKLSYSSQNNIKTGAKVLLSEKGNPIVVTQNMGKGKVVWSGANFFYRSEEYRKNGINEVKPINYILHNLLGDLSKTKVDSKVTMNTPEKITLSGSNFSGVVLKENHWPGWVAKVNAGGRNYSVPVFSAGPELMYIPIPKEVRKDNIIVKMNYLGGPISWIGFIVSAISLVICLIYLLFGNIFHVKLGGRILGYLDVKKYLSKISGWWGKEEE